MNSTSLPTPPGQTARDTTTAPSRFVGRAAELAMFGNLLDSHPHDVGALYVYGPGGIGKSWLLAEMGRLAEARGALVIALDGRSIAATQHAVREALAEALHLPPDGEPMAALAAAHRRVVVLLDSAEQVGALDTWLREELLAALPPGAALVLATRQPPAVGWRSAPRWRDAWRPLSMRSFSREEGQAFMARHGVPASQRDAVLRFTHGHPLALSLVADVLAQEPTATFSPQNAPDVVHALLQQFVEHVPGPAHRLALDAAALLRTTTEPALAATLGVPDAHGVFEWLRSLSFVSSGADGLFPHDLARETLLADLRWRNPDRFIELFERAGEHCIARSQSASHQLQQRAVLDYIYLQCHHPGVRPFFEWRSDIPASFEFATSADVPAMVRLVERHEGPHAAAIAQRMFGRSLEAVVVARESDGQVAGLLAPVSLERMSADELAGDPGCAACWRWLQGTTPLRAGERATVFRFWMSRDDYQTISSISSVLRILILRYILTTPRLATTFIVLADGEYWKDLNAFIEMPVVPEAAFTVGGRRYDVSTRDWRRLPPAQWLHQLTRTGAAAAPMVATPPAERDVLLVLGQDAFADAVRDALRTFHGPRPLANNPLLQSRLVVERAGPGASTAARTAALKQLVGEALEALGQAPKGQRLQRVLDRTFIHPAPSQQQAAEMLDLPFSTYRRHLNAATDWLVKALWAREVGENPAE